jgi:putative ABC transport system permease protein
MSAVADTATERVPPAEGPRSRGLHGTGAGRAAPLGWLRERGMGASVLVAAISSAFGAVLLTATGFIAAVLRADPYIGDSETLAIVLAILGVLLVGVAVYVASIVTANTFATVVAGRTRRIALLRLIGASARSQRAEVARQGLAVGVIGAVVGLVAGTVLSAAGILLAQSSLGIDDVEYAVVQPVLVIPALVVALTTWAAAWAGSRRVLTVTPLQALGGSVEASHDAYRRRAGRNGGAVALFGIGGALLAGGIALGLVTPLGVVVAFFGGIFSFTGLALGATVVMPPVLRLVGRAFGRSATSRLAAENALRYPERSSRMAIGVVMGVTLVTMFAVALETVKVVIAASAGGEIDTEFEAIIDTFAGVMMGLVAVSAVIAAVGLVNLLTIGVVQRRRELGLLRALGVSNGQVRRMVLLEAAHITIAATATGLVLGVAYGWAGAQSLLGSVAMPPAFTAPNLVAPAVPWLPVALIVVATAVLTLVAAVVPTRLATRVAPVEALAD